MVSYVVGENYHVRFPILSSARPCKCSSGTRAPSAMLEQAVLGDKEMSGCAGGFLGMKETKRWSNGQSLYGRAMILCR